MKKQIKKGKGFTLTELVIVIVIIAILAAVLIPTYTGMVNKTKDSNDTSLVKMLNDAMMDSEFHDDYSNDTFYNVINKTLYDYGFVATNLQAKSSKNTLVWNQVTNRFYILTDTDTIDTRDSNPDPNDVEYNGGKLIDAKYTFWVIYNGDSSVAKIEDNKIVSDYSVYLGKTISNTTLTTDKGIDVGDNTGITSINYSNSDSCQDAIIRTNGGTLNVGTSSEIALGKITHYGVAQNVTAYVDTNCFYTHGKIANLDLEKGKFVALSNGLVYLMKTGEVSGSGDSQTIIAKEDGGKILIEENTLTNSINETIAQQLNYTVTDNKITSGTSRDNSIEINSLADLEDWRDSVNQGFSFAGLTVKLTADIDISSKAWVPAGVVSDTKAYTFLGTFDGQNHTIKGLNNANYQGNVIAVSSTSKTVGSLYGFFSFLTNTSGIDQKVVIKDLKLEDVNIDTSSGNGCGALVGGTFAYISAGTTADGTNPIKQNAKLDILIDNVDITGTSTIKAQKKVGSLIGTASYGSANYLTTQAEREQEFHNVVIKNCETSTNTSIISTVTDESKNDAHKIGGFVGTLGTIYSLKFENCTNNAKIVTYVSTGHYDVGQFIGYISVDQMVAYNVTTGTQYNCNKEYIVGFDNCQANGTIVYYNQTEKKEKTLTAKTYKVGGYTVNLDVTNYSNKKDSNGKISSQDIDEETNNWINTVDIADETNDSGNTDTSLLTLTMTNTLNGTTGDATYTFGGHTYSSSEMTEILVNNYFGTGAWNSQTLENSANQNVKGALNWIVGVDKGTTSTSDGSKNDFGNNTDELNRYNNTYLWDGSTWIKQ